MNMHVVEYNSNSCYIGKQYFIVRKFSTVLYDAENIDPDRSTFDTL